MLSDPSQNHRLTALSAAYGLVAVRPTSEKLLLQACTTLECDMISLDFSARLPFALKHKTVGSALLRGLSFEICYSAAATDANARRCLLQNAAALVRATRGGRGIIVSSDARSALALRAPDDIVNLAAMWGLSAEKARDAVAGRARVVVRQAEMRRRGFKGVVEVVDDGMAESERVERKRKAEEQGGGAGKKGKQAAPGNGAGEPKMSKQARRAALKTGKQP